MKQKFRLTKLFGQITWKRSLKKKNKEKNKNYYMEDIFQNMRIFLSAKIIEKLSFSQIISLCLQPFLNLLVH